MGKSVWILKDFDNKDFDKIKVFKSKKILLEYIKINFDNPFINQINNYFNYNNNIYIFFNKKIIQRG